MKLQHLIVTALLATLSSHVGAQNACRPIELNDPRGSVWITAKNVVQPGDFCLTSDIDAPRVRDWNGERGYPNSSMLVIAASNVVFDLHGFTMNIEARGMVGVSSGYWKDSKPQRKIVIRNGTIKSRTRSAILFNAPKGNLISDFTPMYQTPGFAEDELQKVLKELPQNLNDYTKTEYLIERMKIAADTINDGVICWLCKAIGMKGAANTIRNSTIEINDGHAAIYLFGPNQLIENNIIIFKGKAAVESAAAIKLHQADNTIIRNNDIIIESAGDEAPKAAISLIDSKNVIAENNRIYGIKTLMHAWDDKSSIVDRNNDFRSMLRRPLTIGEPGVH